MRKIKMKALPTFTLGFIAAVLLTATGARAGVSPHLILNKSADLPITAFNLTFRVGSADDPSELSGLANLTAHLMREGGVLATKVGSTPMPARTRAELEEYMFPLAADIDVSSETEQVSFRVTASSTDAMTVFNVLAQMVTAPAFNAGEFDRLKAEETDALTKALPREDEEELGKAALFQRMYGAGHPYSHVTTGSVSGLRRLTVDKIKAFYKTTFTRRRLTVAIAGVVSPQLAARARTVFSGLAEGTTAVAHIPATNADGGRELHLTIVKGPFDATGVHLGAPLPINRASRDFPDLYLAAWAFGKHRSFVGRLMKSVREVRGLNYGTYSYVENFPGGGSRLSEPTQAARTAQAFTVWARPTPPENGCFLLRQVFRETSNLASEGLTSSEFELTQSHLVGNAPLQASGLERRLGYAIDSQFYGIKGDYLGSLQNRARRARLAHVNELLHRYLHPRNMEIVVVTRDPEEFKKQILSPRCDIHYASGVEKPGEVLAEDKVIAAYPMGLKPENIQIVTSESVFE
ncbi:MAG: insulinase family protein [Deltaproteobacteria bacterium]|nr:insulinase family protein [Deltaproteobacteria bacterium]